MATTTDFFSKLWQRLLSNVKNGQLSVLGMWNAALFDIPFLGITVRPWHFTVVIAYRLGQYAHREMQKQKNRRLAQRRYQQLQEEIAEVPKLDSNLITSQLAEVLSQISATELVALLQKGEVSAEQALRYFAAMAVESHKRFNCLTDVMWSSALARAKELDRIFQDTGKPVGPLHGLPISIKECISVKGTSSTAGIAQYIPDIATEDAAIVSLLKRAGAIIYIKTNNPQTLMISETSNPIYGTSVNPYDPKRTPGGSSGGEGIIVASGGSPIGIGSDIGGSIRMPAAWCGVYGMKPTAGRITTHKVGPKLFPGMEFMTATAGPICRTVDDAALIYRVLHDGQMSLLDPTIPDLPWKESEFTSTRPLTIGFFMDDGFFTPSHSHQRGVKMAVEHLKAKGHTVVEFVPHSVATVVSSFFSFTTGDGVPFLRNLLSYEDIDPCIRQIWFGLRLPWMARFLAWNIFRFLGWHGMKSINQVWAGSAAYDRYQAFLRSEYKKELIRRIQDAEIDVIICPGPAIPPPIVNTTQLMPAALHSTFFWNAVNFPAAVVPVTTVTKEDLEVPRQIKELTDRVAAQSEAGSVSLPVSVQVVALPWNDEVVMRVSRELESLHVSLSEQLRINMTQTITN